MSDIFGVKTDSLVSSKHIERFENKLHSLIDEEYELISNELDKENNSESVEECLWRRYDQLRFIRAMLDGKYKYDPAKSRMNTNETVEFLE